MKKILTILAVLGLVAAAVEITAKNYHKSPNTTEPAAPAVQPSTPPVLNRPSPPVSTPPGKPHKRQKTGLQQAVKAAALATRNLSKSQFLPTAQLHRIVQSSVVPAKRTAIEQAYELSGPRLARAWGYADTSQVLSQANYYVSAIKYRAELFTKDSASIALYTITHWVTAAGKEYLVPYITVVRMRKLNGAWWYVGSHDPPASQAPTPKLNLSYQQTISHFQPYLKEFQDYESTP